MLLLIVLPIVFYMGCMVRVTKQIEKHNRKYYTLLAEIVEAKGDPEKESRVLTKERQFQLEYFKNYDRLDFQIINPDKLYYEAGVHFKNGVKLRVKTRFQKLSSVVYFICKRLLNVRFLNAQEAYWSDNGIGKKILMVKESLIAQVSRRRK